MTVSFSTIMVLMRRASTLLLVLLFPWTPCAEAAVPIDLPTIASRALKASVLVIAYDERGSEVAHGSGFIVKGTSFAVTNFHVVEGAASVVLKFENGAFFKVLGLASDDKDRDIAILRVEGSDLQGLQIVASDNVRVGQGVVAVGNPLSLEETVSEGIVSAIRTRESLRLIQVAAPISHGSSGGALLNTAGEVIVVPQVGHGHGIRADVFSTRYSPTLTTKR